MLLKFLDVGCSDESELRPWTKAKKVTPEVLDRVQGLSEKCEVGHVAFICAGAHRENAATVSGVVRTKTDRSDADKPDVIVKKPLLRVLDQFLVYSGKSGSTRRKRGCGQAGITEAAFVGTSQKSKSPEMLKVVERLNKSGSSHDDTFLGLDKLHHKAMPQLSAEGKRALLKYRSVVDVSSIDENDIPNAGSKTAGESKRHMKSRKRVHGCWPLNWDMKSVTTYREIFHMTGATHVQDWSQLPDGNAAVAAISLGLSYTCLHVSPAHLQYLLKTVDAGIIPFLSVPGPLYVDAMKPLVAKHFPARPEPKAEDESESESGSE